MKPWMKRCLRSRRRPRLRGLVSKLIFFFMSPFMKRHVVLAALFGAICAVGCGQSHTPLAPVTGNVTYRGKPLASGTIIFESGRRLASGKIFNGKIAEVTTYRKNDGAPIGAHRVAIQAAEIRDDSAIVSHPGAAPTADGYMGVGKSLIPARFRDPKTSGLTCDVKPGVNDFDFDLVD